MSEIKTNKKIANRAGNLRHSCCLFHYFQEGLSYSDISMDTASTSKLSSPSTPGSSMSVQAYTSQFIKDGLRIKMKQKLGTPHLPSGIAMSPSGTLMSPSSPPPLSPDDIKIDKNVAKRIKLEDLNPDDACRRMRRRERNKVAATKCRNKKKARTVNLMKVIFFSLFVFDRVQRSKVTKNVRG